MLLLLLIGVGATTPPPPAEPPFQSDTYRYDSAGGTGSIAGGTVLPPETNYD